jgi:peroxiredoxin (alkyl hydroperoxide reductase subunit C)
MAEEAKPGCARPTGGPVGEETPEETAKEAPKEEKEVKSMAHVGKKAPDFIAPGYQKGNFVNVQLSQSMRSMPVSERCP